MTEFERITRSPETLAAFLASLPCIDGPWDVEFQKRFCSGCARTDCDSGEPCPHAAERSNEDSIVILFYLIDAGFEYAFTAYGVNQPYFQPRQFNVGREQVNALVMVQDASGNIDGFIINDVLHDGGERVGQVVWSAVTERHG